MASSVYRQAAVTFEWQKSLDKCVYTGGMAEIQHHQCLGGEIRPKTEWDELPGLHFRTSGTFADGSRLNSQIQKPTQPGHRDVTAVGHIASFAD